jgi:hypothetical protein
MDYFSGLGFDSNLRQAIPEERNTSRDGRKAVLKPIALHP